jgi:site-specific DNA-methyltransferase (adenine-specific)
MNTLYYGDNLKILREYIKDESVDLVYLDPPFNSNRNYNVLFRDESGLEADSQIHAFEASTGKAKRVVVQVKSGHVKSGDIRDLGHTMDREKAEIGVFLTLEKPSKDMVTEAVGKGYYHSPGWNRDYPKLQILTVEELLAGKEVQLPPNVKTFKQAEKISQSDGDQITMFSD